jgi:hypothetical protein
MKQSHIVQLVFGLLISLIIFESCRKEEPIEPAPFSLADCIPVDGFPGSAFAYAQMVESELGVVPTVVLDSMVEIPLYQNGNQVYGVFYDANSIDNPSRLGKLTVSGSALQRYEGRTANGTPLPDVIWIAFLRNVTTHVSKPNGSVQLIG